MRTRSIQPGDIVFCNKGGRLFHAKVVGAGVGGVLAVQPIERNISYRQVHASEIADHWSHSVVTRREDRPADAQIALDLDQRPRTAEPGDPSDPGRPSP